MAVELDRKRIFIFLGIAFGLAWLTGLAIFLSGGLRNSPRLFGNITVAIALLSTLYMWSPALAHIFTRLLTHEGWQNAGIRPYIKQAWPYWIYPWVLPAVLTILGALLFFVIFPQYYGGLDTAQRQFQQANRAVPANLWLVIAGQLGLAILVSPPVNILATFGEEYGWRAYLLPKLIPLGGRYAAILLGMIWGVWHWPVIAMGYEYGLSYTGFPFTGMLFFMVFTVSASCLLSWVTMRGRSVWPAAIGHAAINGIAAVAAIFIKGSPSTLLGPYAVGLIGGIPFLVFALALILSRNALEIQLPTSLPFTEAKKAPWKK